MKDLLRALPWRKSSAAIVAALTLQSGPLYADATLSDAVWLVQELYREQGRSMTRGEGPVLNLRNPSLFFLVDSLAVDGLQARLGFDPLYDAQDFDISSVRIQPDAEAPMFRGSAQIRAEFTNFGAPQSLLYTLVKVQPGDVWQISDIYSENNGWSLSQLAYQYGLALPATADDISHPDQNAVDDRPWDPSTFVNGVIPPSDASFSPDDAQEVILVPAQMVIPVDPDANVGMEQGDLPAYGLNTQGNDLLIILDASGSMWGQIDGVAKIATAKTAIRGLVADLPAETNVGLMAYGHRRDGDCADTQILLPVSSHDRAHVQATVDAITPRGKTPIAGALSAAGQAFSGSGRSANVLLISDGRETCGGDPCAAAAQLAQLGVNTRVHAVGFDLSDADHAALKCVADEGNGSYFTADNAEELVGAIEQVAADVAPPAVPVPEPAPAPTEPAIVFEETFDGPAIAEAWSIKKPEPLLSELDGEGALFVAVAGTQTTPTNPDARNRYVLDQPLPEGDFDLVLDFRFVWQTGNETMALSLYQDAGNQILAEFLIETAGCGSVPVLRLSKMSDGAVESRFEADLFDILDFGGICSGGDRPYGDRILRAMEDGTRLTLSRRGRVLQAGIAFDLPGKDGTPSRRFEHKTEDVTALRLSGNPSFLAGQNPAAKERESIFRIDHFGMERVADQ